MTTGRQEATPIQRSASAEALPDHGGAPETGAGPRRSRRGETLLSHLLANSAPLLLLLAWWLTSRTVPPYVMPEPFGVFRRSATLLFGSESGDTWTSMSRIVISVALAMVVGGALVFLSGALPVTERLVGNRILPFFNSVPALGWAILGVIWFGIGNFAVVFVVTAIVIPFCMVNLWEGMRALDPELREMGRSFTRSRWRVLMRIEAPLLLPYIFAATRLSFSVGWKVALIAEFFGASAGLGLVMNRARQNFDSETVFACVIVVLVIVTAAERLVFDPVGRWFARRSGTAARA